MSKSVISSHKTEFTLLAVIMFVFLAAFLAAVWINSIDNWCANPEGKGNWIVQPYCTEESTK